MLSDRSITCWIINSLRAKWTQCLSVHIFHRTIQGITPFANNWPKFLHRYQSDHFEVADYTLFFVTRQRPSANGFFRENVKHRIRQSTFRFMPFSAILSKPLLFYLYGPSYIAQSNLLIIFAAYYSILSVGSCGNYYCIFGKYQSKLTWSRTELLPWQSYVSRSLPFYLLVGLLMTFSITLLNFYIKYTHDC